MKYLYQQLLAFWLIIIMTIVLIGFSFTSINKRTLINQNYNQIRGYLQSVGTLIGQTESEYDNYSTPEERLPAILHYAETVLTNQSINFALINSDGLIQYPEEHVRIPDSLMNRDEVLSVLKGDVLQKTIKGSLKGENHQTSYVVSSIYLSKKQKYILIASKSASDLEQSEKLITDNLIKGCIISLLFGGAISFAFAARQVRKINDLKRAVNQIANGNYDIEIDEKDGKDEFNELARDFNIMAIVLQDNEREINRQEELRKQFMANTSHEMRTPLTTIKGLLEGLEYNAIPETQKGKAIKLMQNETDRLIRLVKQNLDYENIRSHQIILSVTKINVTEEIKGVIAQLEKKAASMNDKLILQNDSSIEIEADRDRFIQIMVNIIQNAIQFTENGEILVNLEEKESEVIISVEDNGIGMTSEEMKNIWDRYFKADPSRKNKKLGESGLGLSIVKELVRIHNGTISVESKKDVGTKFQIHLPKESKLL